MTDELLHIVIAGRAFAPQHGFGGLERASADHLRALARRGVRITVFTQPSDPACPPPDTFPGTVAWRTIPYRRFDLLLRHNAIPDRLLHYGAFTRALGRAIANLAHRERVDIVHAHGLTAAGYANVWSKVESRRSKVANATPQSLFPPLSFNPHGLEEFSVQNWAKWLAYAPFRRGLRAAARAAAATIATDAALAGAIERQLRVPPVRVVTIPNGVDVAALDVLVAQAPVRELRARFGLEAAPLVLLSVARLEQNKGLIEALAALNDARGHLPDGWRWLIVGRGSEEARLRAAIAGYGFARNVTLAGALPDAETQALLTSADLFLTPSLYEGSSLATLEAMARGLPVVATSAGGLPDKVRPGETGWLAPPGDISSLAAALTAALAARHAWPDYGARARALVVTAFDWAALADRYLALYQQLRVAPRQ
jgi:glycosyltransferase involved in cell wall biosynthesis